MSRRVLASGGCRVFWFAFRGPILRMAPPWQIQDETIATDIPLAGRSMRVERAGRSSKDVTLERAFRRSWYVMASFLDLEGTEPAERFTAVFGIAHGALIWLLGGRRPAAAAMIAGDLLCAALVLMALPRLRQARPAAVRFLAVALPLLVFYLFYLQTGLIDASAVHWRDTALAGLQERVVRRVPFIHSTAVRDWFIFAYFAYDPFLAAGALALFVPGNAASQRNAGDAVRRMCYALACCFVVGLLYPALSPRYVTPQLQLEYLGHGTLARFAALSQQSAMVPGNSFPSAHLAATTALMWDLHAARRAVFWLFLPLVLSMAAGTVLFQYHYVPDVVAGIVVGGAAVALDRWCRPLTLAPPGP